MTEQIARVHGITPRNVQMIAKQGGVLRTRAASNKLVAPMKRKRRGPRS